MLVIKNGLMYQDDKVVQQHNSPNRSGALSKPRVLIVHDTASGIASSNGPVSWLCNPKAAASAHFVVGRTGLADLHQLVPTNIKAWHAGKSSYHGERNVNNFSIGIEIVNPGWLTSKDGITAAFSTGSPTYNVAQYGIRQITDDAHPGRYWWMAYTVEQINAVIEMARAIVAAYPTITDIQPHWFIAPGRKVDVNPLFPLDALRAAVFNSRGPVAATPVTTPELDNVPNIPPASLEKDEQFAYDALTTANLNLRPWPDSPKRFGVINVQAQVDIERQSVSQRDGAIWYAVKIRPQDFIADSGSAKDGDGFYRGFVHSKFLRLVA